MANDTRQSGAVLPELGKRSVLVTSALPYVNNVPHLGNIIGSVLSADAFARYSRGRGIRTLYIGGTDEYGTTTEIRALEEKCTPQELCDKYHRVHAEIYSWFNISFDIFGRTTNDLQTQITQQIFHRLEANGLLEERMTTQLYCEKHHAYLADRFVEGECNFCGFTDARGDQCDSCGRILDSLDLKNPRCKVDGSTPVTKDTRHTFLALDKLQPEVETFYRLSSESGKWSSNGKAITAAWLREGLQPRSITRDLRWGTPVPLPGHEEKVFYSWFDACIGYVSITANYTSEWEKWWRNPDVDLYQFLGKDNVIYHSVIFPASQIGTQEPWTKLHHLSTTDYLTYEGGKFSKSRGIGIFGVSARKTGIPCDVWRAFLLYYRPETGDAEFTWDAFISFNNNLLLNNLGNFVSRVLKFVNSQKYYDSIVPDWTAYQDESFDLWKQQINASLTQYIQELDAVKLRAGLATVLRISQLGNLFLQQKKLDSNLAISTPDKCAAVVGLAVNLIHLLASVTVPYMPETARSINLQLSADPLPILDHWTADSIRAGHRINKAAHLFARIKPEKAQEWREVFGTAQGKNSKAQGTAVNEKKPLPAKAA